MTAVTRALAALTPSLLLAAVPSVFAEGTITLSGTTAATCTFSELTMKSDGSIVATCTSTTPGAAPEPTLTCPAIPPGSVAGNPKVNDFQSVDAMKLGSGIVGYYEVPASPSSSVIVEFSQTQMAVTPPMVTTEFQVSRCPGVFDPPGHTIAASCKQRSVFANINNMKIWTAPTAQYPSQAALDAVGGANCLATGGKHYINIRWTYPSCPFGGCGFANRWIQHNDNSPF